MCPLPSTKNALYWQSTIGESMVEMDFLRYAKPLFWWVVVLLKKTIHGSKELIKDELLVGPSSWTMGS
jgi:hypothetical protein